MSGALPDGSAAGPSWGWSPRAGGSRAEVLAVALALLVGLATLPLLTHPWFVPGRDAVIYVETARSLAQGEGYRYLGVPVLVRPPGYALLLAPLAGLGLDTPRAIHLLNGVLGLVGCAALHAFARRRVPWPAALALVACVWLNPVVRRLSNQSMSDVPGLSILLVGLWLERRLARRPSLRGDLALGLLIGLGSYVRTALVLLAPAVLGARLVARLRSRGGATLAWPAWLRRRVLLLALLPLAIALPWNLRNARVAPEPPADQTLVHDYATGIWHEDPGDPGSRRLALSEVLERSALRLPQVAASVASRLQESEGFGAGGVVFGLLGLGALLFTTWRRAEPAELFTLALFCVLCFYFGYNRRLALPILVVVLLALTEVAALLGRRVAGAPGATAVACLVPLVPIATDYRPRRNWRVLEAQDRAAAERAEELAPHLPPDAALASFDGFAYTYWLGRPVYSLCFALRRADGDPDAIPPVLEKYDVHSVLLPEEEPRARRLIPWFRQHFGAPRTVAGVQVFRVR